MKLEKGLCQKVADCLEGDSDYQPGLNTAYLHTLIQKKRFEEALQNINIRKL
jgi:hypothetical protein